MKRYSSTREKFDKSGVRVYSTNYYPEIPISNNDSFIVSKEGDRLDNLAHKYYSDNTLWWVIAKANDIKGKSALKPGENLRIPLNIQRIIEDFRNVNKSG